MKNIEIRRIEYGSKEYKDELDLRNKILRTPLGLDIYDEDLKAEKDVIHFGAFSGENHKGALVLTRGGEGCIRMRQVAVSEGLQGKGLGKKLVEYAEQFSRSEGYKEIMLHSRTTASGFYTNLGYSDTSPVFMEVGTTACRNEKKSFRRLDRDYSSLLWR